MQNGQSKVFNSKANPWRMMLKAMRPHQWVKNLLILAPLATAHAYVEPSAIITAIIAFIAFSLCASGVYVVNDLTDLEADRRHEKKRHRPLASGALSPANGIVASILLFIAAFAIASFVNPPFLLAVAAYGVMTTLYSFWLKRKAAVDVITLAGLYTMRIVAGAVAIGVEISPWLLAFSMFLFLSLAYLKRYTELTKVSASGEQKAAGRGYGGDDAETVFTLGAASGLVSILVIALYIDSDYVRQEYSSPQALWLLCPALLYWVNRIWIGARRGRIDDDPIVFAMRDRVSLAIGAFCIAAAAFARYASF